LKIATLLSEFQKYFSETELEKIDRKYYLTNHEKGIEIVLDHEKIIEAIHLFGFGNLGIIPFSGKLPAGLKFENDEHDVDKMLKSLKFDSGGGDEIPFLGKSNMWRKYYENDYYLRVEFKEEKIKQITIGNL
ncbi:MAG: hypothetical protein AAFN10_23445, partial [Bacteroidota bacterium]